MLAEIIVRGGDLHDRSNNQRAILQSNYRQVGQEYSVHGLAVFVSSDPAHPKTYQMLADANRVCNKRLSISVIGAVKNSPAAAGYGMTTCRLPMANAIGSTSGEEVKKETHVMHDRSYTALVYHHPRGFHVAECLTFPAVSSEGDDAAAALGALARAVAAAVRAGEPETKSEAIITSLTIGPRLPIVPSMFTYTALVTHDPVGYASYCPALGVASQGDTVDEALAMLREASTLLLESQPAPDHDEIVYVERITVPVPDGAPIAQASVRHESRFSSCLGS